MVVFEGADGRKGNPIDCNAVEIVRGFGKARTWVRVSKGRGSSCAVHDARNSVRCENKCKTEKGICRGSDEEHQIQTSLNFS